MEITKEMLLSYKSKKDEIKELTEKIRNRYKDESLIGNDVILDYSRSYPPIPQGIVGFDMEEYKRLQERDQKRKEQLEQECLRIEEFVESITDSMTRRIFRMTFLEGKKQKVVAKIVHMDRSSISKRIDSYLKLSHNSHKSHL